MCKLWEKGPWEEGGNCDQVRAKALDCKPVTVQTMHTLMQLDLDDIQPRSWHIAQPYYCHPHSTECRVVIFGGNVHANTSECSGDRVNTANLKILIFGKQVKTHMTLCIIGNSCGTVDI